MAAFLPYGHQSIDEEDIRAVVEVLRGDWLTTGPSVAALEADFARTVDAQHAVACANGTAALHLAACAAGIGPGDLVVVPAVTFLASANAAHYVGADVLLCDVDPATGLMRADDLRSALARANGRPVRAVIPVHLNGQPVCMPEVAATAREAGLTIIVDGCHGLGTLAREGDGDVWKVGSNAHSECTTFSLHPVKTVTAGEGGVVTTNDPDAAAGMRSLRSHAMVRDPAVFRRPDMGIDARGEPNIWYSEMHELGFNYRLSDLNCALARAQLRRLPGFAARRRELAAMYDERLAALAPRLVPIAKVPGAEPSLHLYVVHIDFEACGVDRAQVMTRLHDRGIGTQVHYIPLQHQPYFRKRYGHVSLPGSDAYYARALSIPLFPAMKDEDVDRVVEALEACLGP